MNRRNFFTKFAICVLGGSLPFKWKLSPAYRVEYRCQFETPEHAKIFYGAKRESWENIQKIQNINHEFIQANLLRSIEKLNTEKEWRWTYTFDSDLAYAKWEQRVNDEQAISRDRIPAGMNYSKTTGWSLV